ncbi:hypothetical protein D3C81_1031450 [compost metagenome]
MLNVIVLTRQLGIGFTKPTTNLPRLLKADHRHARFVVECFDQHTRIVGVHHIHRAAVERIRPHLDLGSLTLTLIQRGQLMTVVLHTFEADTLSTQRQLTVVIVQTCIPELLRIRRWNHDMGLLQKRHRPCR